MELMQPKTQDGQPAQTNAVLKVLPLMIGWFSLNVPSALCVYWVINNIVTTATSLYIRNTLKVEPVVAPGSGRSTTMETSTSTIFSPPRERPSGFGSPSSSSTTGAKSYKDDIKPITAMDAEIVEDTDDEGEDDDDADESTEQTASTSEPSKKRRGKKRKKKSN